MFKIVVAGSRGFNNYNLLKKKLDQLLKNKKKEEIEIVSGHCPDSPDVLGEDYADEKGYKKQLFPADWDKYGKSAGYIRNYDMAKYADACVVFWDEKSNGSRNMIYSAKVRKIQLRVFNFEGKEIGVDQIDFKRK